MISTREMPRFGLFFFHSMNSNRIVDHDFYADLIPFVVPDFDDVSLQGRGAFINL